MARTVLEFVQDILTEMGGDEVNSISDTIEATDVANILKQVYSEIVDEYSLPSTSTLRALEALSDTDLPNVMKIPDDSWDIKWIKYDTRVGVSDNKNYRTIEYRDPDSFVQYVNTNPSTDTTNFQVVQWTADVPLVIAKTKAPTYWTSFDDEFIVFDSYDSDVDSTLQASKSIVMIETRPELVIADDNTVDIPLNLENLLYITTLNRCNAGTRETINPETSLEGRRLRIRAQRNKWRQGRQTDTGPNYGRR